MLYMDLVVSSVNNCYLMLNRSSDKWHKLLSGTEFRDAGQHIKWHNYTFYNVCHCGSWIGRVYFYYFFLYSKEFQVLDQDSKHSL